MGDYGTTFLGYNLANISTNPKLIDYSEYYISLSNRYIRVINYS